MEPGKTIRCFQSSDGRSVLLRTPRWADLDDLLELINSLVEEEAEIYITEKLNREQEAEWLKKVLSRLERNEVFFVVAEVNKAVVASIDLQLQSEDEKQIGVIGVIVKKFYRNMGIGTELMKTVIDYSVRHGLRVLTVNVFSTNSRAIHVYEKVGFAKTETVPKKHFRNGGFVDEVMMQKNVG